MNDFTFIAVTSRGQAIGEFAGESSAAYLAGGTNLLDHLKLGIEQPTRLIDINAAGLDRIEKSGGNWRIGATVRNTDLAYHEQIRQQFPVLSEAILSGASPQLRNMATTAGNLMQRTRCHYFRDGFSPCNKRQPGSGCAAIDGFNRSHALLGASDQCIATHPSDMDVAMMALGAVIHVSGKQGDRAIPIEDFYIAYGQEPAKETTLRPGELITAVELPATTWFARSTYLKARDRASFEFALASAAVALDLDGSKIRDVRIALGGVATRPWRAHAAEAALRNQSAGEQSFAAAAEAELKPAVAREHNGFKIPLCKRVIVRALSAAAQLKV